jgi:hypothetical protein
MSARGNRPLRIGAALLIAYGVVGLPGPLLFPMNLRGSAPIAGDVPHIVLTGVLVLLMLAAMAFVAVGLGRRFRLYTLATIAIMLAFGAATGITAAGLAAGKPAPWVGLLERIDIGAFLVWVAVLAVALLRAADEGTVTRPARGALRTEGVT